MQQALKPSPTHEHPSEHKTGHDSSETENEISEDVGRCIEQAAAAHKRHRLHRERRKRRETTEEADRQQQLPRTGRELVLLGKQQQHAHDEPHEETADRIDRQRAEREHRPEPRAHLRRHEIPADRSEPAAEEDEKNGRHEITLSHAKSMKVIIAKSCQNVHDAALPCI